MSYEKKIQKELNKHDQQWCDAVCPSVTKFGIQADKEVKLLKSLIKDLKTEVDVSDIGMI